MVPYTPKRIHGPWNVGFVLDRHTISSTPLGYDSYGNMQFDTKRSPLGELLYRTKYAGDEECVIEIVSTVINFLRSRDWNFDAIVPAPPSKTREFQPVIKIAGAISNEFAVPCLDELVSKASGEKELKNVYDFSERRDVLKRSLSISGDLGGAKRLLVIDDLFRSGATMSAVITAIKAKFSIDHVYALALTKTKS